ncbi:MAG: DUF4105 domain-containing protein [Bacteroides sp.]|uniref:lipoprotein N-acyltransferase Lnb n=2 Tax=Bacteroides sp. TaxID=29523 RepID=UPI002FCC44A7
MMHIVKIILITLFLASTHTLRAAQEEETPQAPVDSIRLSLLTCAPGEEIYSLFGHTAIRYENPARGIDAVFNYGMFSFNTPNFILRFALGQTDYELGVSNYERFASEYSYYGRSVWQQNLNLTPQEKQKLVALLEANYQPQNRVYRYNFFYDNCATRPRDIIEESVAGKVIYAADPADANQTRSFRDIVHQYTQGHPWAQFGIDLCIGSEADRPIDDRQTMFAPFYLMNFFSTAHIAENSRSRSLITDTEKIVDCEKWLATQESEIEKEPYLPTPLQVALALFMLTAGATIYGLKKKKGLWGIDLVLFGTAGIAGCILAFLALFSEHPAVSSNYLLLVFHPGQLFCLPFIIYAVRKKKRSWYHLFNFIVLTFFILLFPLIPQRFDLAVVPLALCLLIRSASNLILTYKHKK